MYKKTLNQVQDDLQELLDNVGTEQFPITKALYMKDVEIVDADGRPLSEEDLDIEITMKMDPDDEYGAKAEEEEENEDKAEEEDENELKAELEEDEEEEKAEEDEDDAEADRKPARRSPAARRGPAGVGGKPADRRGQVGGGLGGGRSGGGRSYTPKSAEVSELVKKALAKNINPVRTKGLKTMRIDNEREGLKSWGALKHMSRIQSADPELAAYKFGRWAAACMGHKKSADWCANRGINVKAHTEGVNSQGGFLVPDEFSDTLISLREVYGVARRNCKIEPMASDTKRIPIRTATLSANFVGEATAGTESTQTFNQATLVAKKLMVLTTLSSELNEDALVNLGDSVAGECAYSFALKEDQCAFLGTGASTFGGIVGIINALNNVSSNAGIHTCASDEDLPADVDLQDLHELMGKLPAYADSPNCKFYMHKGIYSAICERLIYSSGGASARERAEGVQGTSFLGYPVEFVQVMPDATTGSTGADGDQSDETYRFPILFGDLAMACSFGDRRDNTIAFSDSALNAFEQDEVVVRATERFDFLCHSPGTATEAGPVVGLKLNTN